MQWVLEASRAICPEDIALFTPDGLLWHHLDKRVVIYEFSRCMGTEAADMEERHTQKAQAYHVLQLYLQRLLPDHCVELRTYVMSITGSVPDRRWGENLQAMGIAEQLILAVHSQAVINTVQSLSEYLGVRCTLAPHSFPLNDTSLHTSLLDPSGSAGSCETVGSPSSNLVYQIQFQCGAPMQCDSFSAIPI
eukprot:3178657-Rhodomonas_salina.3